MGIHTVAKNDAEMRTAEELHREPSNPHGEAASARGSTSAHPDVQTRAYGPDADRRSASRPSGGYDRSC